MVGRLAPAVVVCADECVDRLSGIELVGLQTSADFVASIADADPKADAHTDPDQVAVWLFTSGTTGAPKAALLRHRHLVSYVLSTVEFMVAEPHEATLVSVPPYHIAGMATILSNTYAGRRIVYVPQFDADEWVALAGARRSRTRWWSPRCSAASSTPWSPRHRRCPRCATSPMAVVACRYL